MKKFLLFLTLFLSAVGIAQAAEEVTDVVACNLFSTKTSNSYTDYTYTSTTTNAIYAAKVCIDYINISGSNVLSFRLNSNSQSFFCVSQAAKNAKLSKIVFHKTKGSKNVKIYANNQAYTATATGTPGGTLITTLEKTPEVGDFTIDFSSEDLKTSNYIAFYVVGPSGSTNFSSIDVTWEITGTDSGDTKTDPELSFAQTSYSANLGETFDLPELAGVPDGATISWTSTATDVAEFVDGVLKIKAVGSTTITATTSATTSYKEGNASFILNVVDPNSPVYTVKYSDFKADTDLGAVTVGDIRFVFSKGTSTQYTPQNNGSHLKFYGGNTMDITAPEGFVIDKIEFICTSKDYAVADRIASASENGTTTTPTNGTVATWSLKDDATATQTVSIKNTTNSQARIKSIVIYCSKYSSKEPAGLAYSPAEVTLVEGDELAEQPTLKNPNKLTVTYSSRNTDVATVDANTGVISLAGGLGTAVITASTEGDATHKAGSATFTITVNKAQVAYLVTDASTLKEGDIIIIANQDEAMAISNKEKTNNRAATAVNFNSDKSEIHSISNDVMLFELKVYTDKQNKSYWMLYTTNYTGTNGALYCSSGTSTNSLKIGTPDSNQYDAVITIDQETGEAKIVFNKGATEGNNILRYYSSDNLFNCYSSTSTQKSVYIYKVTDKPETVETQVCGGSFAEANSSLDVKLKFKTSTTANQVAIFMNDVMVGTFNVSDGKVDATINNAPYLTDAKFTMRPVLKSVDGVPTQLGPSEALEVTWPTLPTFDVTAKTPKWYYSKFYTVPEDETTYADLDLWIYMTPSVTTTLSYTFAEFANSVAGKEIWGWYDESKEQLQNCKYNFLTKVPVTGSIPVVSEKLLSGKEATATFTPVFLFNVDSKYSSLISGSTRAAAPALLSEETPILVQEVNGTKISESIDVSALTGAEVSGVESVVVEGVDGAVEYYNMQGVRVEGELAPGMYIRRQGRSVSKVQIR